MKPASLILVVLLLIFPPVDMKFNNGAFAQDTSSNPPFIHIATPWADSVFATLSDEEKIAQLFMVAAYSNKDKKHEEELENLVRKQKIGGLIFFQGGPVRQAKITNRLQEISDVPLFIAMDAEWGLAMRLDSTVKYPWQMTLGAIQDNALIYEMGKDIAEQMNRLGVQINFAPVVDVNVNPANPVINARSFGENKYTVAEKGIAYMKGLQFNKVLANAKHFPGHGDTDKDSHKTLPVINHSRERLDSVELYPFRQLFDNGLSSVMVAHLYVPAYVKELNEATTLSREVVQALLKDTMAFKGLVFTDALNMSGVSSKYEPGIVDLKALLAGNDVLLFAQDVPKAINEIQKAVERGEISMDEIGQRCLKILRAKEWSDLHKFKKIELSNLYKDLNEKKYELLNKRLTASSLTILRNERQMIPLKRLDTLKIAYVSTGEEDHRVFQETLSNYTKIRSFHFPKGGDALMSKRLLDSLSEFNTVIVSIHQNNASPFKSFAIDGSIKDFVNVLRLRKTVILDVFSNPYSLIDFEGAQMADVLIMSYQNSEYAQQLSAELIFGGAEASGKLPVSLSPKLKEGFGIPSTEVFRLNYVQPEEKGFDSEQLALIDTIALKGIKEMAYPGCQVLVAKSGSVIYNKAFGFHTYDRNRSVKLSDVYDIASITKIAATLLAVMKLNDEGKIDLDRYLCDYLPELTDTTVFANISLREILAHQAGLPAWIPFYKKTLVAGMPRYDVYSLVPSDLYSKRVAENLYINHTFRDSIMGMILSTNLNEKKEYKYSDLGYYFLQRIVEKISGDPLDEYLDNAFYRPMGMSDLGYLPRKRLTLDRIIPTEKDPLFRKQLIHGDVHDPGAAMMGGVGGHAGLFTNANDLAKIMQMYLNNGQYGGKQYISDSIVNEYTRCQYCEDDNRRGAGFDKPVRDGGAGPTCNCVSFASFGHSGFTGTIAWADPEEDIIYIFLSNRVHPDAANKKIIELNIRTAIQEVVYDANSASKLHKTLVNN